MLGGEKISISKPRVRSKDGCELTLSTLSLFQEEDPLNKAMLERLLCGISTRKYDRALEAGEIEHACTSKSEVSRRFVTAMQTRMDEFFSRRIEEDYPVLMLDGTMLGKMTVVVAMGIASNGKKRVLGLIEGGSENQMVASALLSDLIARGLDPEIPRLFVLDGGKGLHKAVKDTFGKMAIIQRCQVHKKRNVLSHLPESEQANVGLSISRAYLEYEYDKAKTALELLAENLEERYPSAAVSLREGMEETLTVHRLSVPGLLRKTLSNTNAMESANGVCMSTLRRISNFRDGQMVLRHAAAGYMEAERSFRRVKGYRQIPLLTAALARICLSDSVTQTSKIA